MKATERRKLLIEMLCERRFERVENLAFEFSVNECTIRRDIQELSLSYPIYTKPGTHGGVYIAKDYYLGKQYLVEEEKSLLEKLSKSVCQEETLLLKAIIKKFGKTNCVEGRR